MGKTARRSAERHRLKLGHHGLDYRKREMRPTGMAQKD
jgi:hypothetical protein